MTLTTKLKKRQIISLVKNGKYEQAYLVGSQALNTNPNNQDILESLRYLTARLRSLSMDFASKKINYAQHCPTDDILEKANELTGEDFYGNY